MEWPAVRFRSMSYRIGGKTILDSLDLDIDAEDKVAILGPNGSGKSSLIRIMRGEARPWSGCGDSMLFGRSRWNLFELRSLMGVVSPELERCISPRTRAWDLVASGLFQSYDVYRCHELGEREKELTDEAVSSLGLGPLAGRAVSTLSTGEMRRFLIARALVNDPMMLVLDEPMTGLDIIARKLFRETLSALAASGKGLVIASHDLEDIIPEVDRVIMLKDGKVFRDGPKAEVLNDETMSSLFGTRVTLMRSGDNYHANVG